MDEYILKMEDISKHFPGVRALDGVSFDCIKGEVHALVGENGAGKSTLMKILSGAYQPDSGHIYLDGLEVTIDSPKKGQQLGITIIMQEFNLLPYLTVEQNIFLGREPILSAGIIDEKEITRRSKELLSRLGFEIDPKAVVEDLSVAQLQFVEIAKALSLGANILIMDEPSATLTGHELEALFDVIEDLKARGVSIIYISHRLVEIFRIADRVTVLKDGRKMDTRLISEVQRDDLIEMMVGRSLAETFPPRGSNVGEMALKVSNLNGPDIVRDASFEVRCGEIVGIAGLVGAGRTELVQTIFGTVPLQAGEIEFQGKPIRICSPHDSVRAGIVLVPEDRKLEGLVEIQSVRKNIGLPNLDLFSKFGFLQPHQELSAVHDRSQQLNIRASSPEQTARDLSGGNQQKVVLAKWLVRQPKLIILDEPTRGIDVAAKSEIYHIMRDLANAGVAVLMISSELPEILGMADRILVMCEGKLVAEFAGGEVTEEQVMQAATGSIDQQIVEFIP